MEPNALESHFHRFASDPLTDKALLGYAQALNDLDFFNIEVPSSYCDQQPCSNDTCAYAFWPNCRCKCGGKNHGKKYEQLRATGVHITLPKDLRKFIPFFEQLELSAAQRSALRAAGHKI